MPTKLDASVAEVERIQNPPVIICSLVNVLKNQQYRLNLEAIINLRRHGSMLKLIRVIGLVLRFVDLLKAKGSSGLNVLEVRRAEDVWVRSIQLNSFPDELGEAVNYRSQLALFLVEDEHIH